jgi:lipopolysaccharide assembly outer membrane protein LptD (OstA)
VKGFALPGVRDTVEPPKGRTPVRSSLLLFIAALACLLVWPGSAQEDEGAEPDAPRAEENGEAQKPILVSADEIRANEIGDGKWEIIGDVEMVQEDTTMYAEYVVWDRNENTAVFTRSVRIVDPTNRIFSDRADVDFDAETMTLTENVRILTQQERPEDQEPDPDSDVYEYGEWTTTADRLLYNYGNDTGEARGNVRTVSEDGEYTLLADVAYYEVDADGNEIITLPDNPRVETPDDEYMTAEKAVITIPPEEKSSVHLLNVRGMVLPEEEDGESPPAEEAEEGPQPTIGPGEGEAEGSGFEGMPPPEEAPPGEGDDGPSGPPAESSES